MTIAKFDPEFAHLVDPSGETHTQTIIVQTSEQNSIETNSNSDDDNDHEIKNRKVKLLVPPIKVKTCIENKREEKRRKYIEQVTAYKCRICNELGTYISAQ